VSAEPVQGPGGGREPEDDAAPAPGPGDGRDPAGPGDGRDPAGPGAGTAAGDSAGPEAGIPEEAGAGGHQVWGAEDAQAGADPYSSRPPEYAGVPIRELFPDDDAEMDDGTGVAEAWEAGFLPRDVPAPRRAGAAGGFASGGPLDGSAAGSGGGRVRRGGHRPGRPVRGGDR
jgi:hypothetical protein